MLRAALFYVVAAWIVLQVADLALPGLGIHERAIRYVWIAVLIGFPVALLFAWRYDITAGGVVLTPAHDQDPAAERPLRTRDFVLLSALGVVTLAIIFGVVQQIRDAGSPGTALENLLTERLGPLPVESAGRAIHPHSIAVLPLANMSGDPEQDYFVAGIHEALITDLSKVTALRVISRTSTNAYRNTDKPLPQIGRELAVANVIEGSVIRIKDQVRITVQLIDAVTDQHRWAESYERNIADVLTLQREIARLVAGQIAATLTPDETKRLAIVRPVNPATYEAYLRGMYHLNQFTPEGIAKGLEYLKQAVGRDPADPLAYAGLAVGYSMIGHGTGPRESFPRAKEAVLKALALDPDLPEAHAALAEIQLYYDWDWPRAEASFKRALQLNPSLDFAHAHYAWYLQLMGRIDDAFAEMKTARQLAPLNSLWSSWLAWMYWDAGRLDEALQEAEVSLELVPEFSWGLFVAGSVRAAQGRFDEAIALHQRIAPDQKWRLWGLAQANALAGRHDEARKLAAEIALAPEPKDLMILAAVHANLGDMDEAIRWAEAAYEARVDWFPWIGNASLSGALHRDPRFAKILERLNLPR